MLVKQFGVLLEVGAVPYKGRLLEMHKFPRLLRGEAVPQSLWSQVPTVISRVGAWSALSVRDRGPNAAANEKGVFCPFYYFFFPLDWLYGNVKTAIIACHHSV